MYLTIVINVIVTAIVGSVSGILVSKWNENNAQSQALKCMMRKEIITLVEKCIQQGYVTNEEMEQLEEYNTAYRKLNGNSFVKTLMVKAEDLYRNPLKSKESK